MKISADVDRLDNGQHRRLAGEERLKLNVSSSLCSGLQENMMAWHGTG